MASRGNQHCANFIGTLSFPISFAADISATIRRRGWLGSRVVSVLDSGAEGPGFRSQSRRCRVTVLGKLFTPIVPLFTCSPSSKIGSSPLSK